jgi:hypothetical protein
VKRVIVLSRPSQLFAVLALIAALGAAVLFLLHSFLYLLLLVVALVLALGALVTGPFHDRRLGIALIAGGILLAAGLGSLPVLAFLSGALILGGLYELARPSFA